MITLLLLFSPSLDNNWWSVVVLDGMDFPDRMSCCQARGRRRERMKDATERGMLLWGVSRVRVTWNMTMKRRGKEKGVTLFSSLMIFSCIIMTVIILLLPHLYISWWKCYSEDTLMIMFLWLIQRDWGEDALEKKSTGWIWLFVWLERNLSLNYPIDELLFVHQGQHHHHHSVFRSVTRWEDEKMLIISVECCRHPTLLLFLFLTSTAQDPVTKGCEMMLFNMNIRIEHYRNLVCLLLFWLFGKKEENDECILWHELKRRWQKVVWGKMTHHDHRIVGKMRERERE